VGALRPEDAAGVGVDEDRSGRGDANVDLPLEERRTLQEA